MTPRAALHLIDGVARFLAIVALAGVSFWCLYGYVTAAFEPGWLLGVLASRLASHSIATTGLRPESETRP